MKLKAVFYLSIRVQFSAGHLKTNDYIKSSFCPRSRIQTFAFQKMMRRKVSEARFQQSPEACSVHLSETYVEKYTSECNMCTSVFGTSSEVFFNLLKLHLHQETRIL